jgi:hypothetical protein
MYISPNFWFVHIFFENQIKNIKIKFGAVPRGPAPEVLSCRRTPRRLGLNVMRHGGRDAAAVGYGSRCIFLEIFSSSIYFSNIKEKI